MHPYSRFVFLAITAFLLLSGHVLARAETPAGSQSKNPFAGDKEAIAAAKPIFEAVCSGYCHATEASNRAGRCPNLFDCEWKHGGSETEIFRAVAQGVANTEMLGFKGKLPDDMLWKIIAYVRSASKCQQQSSPVVSPAH